MEPTDTIGDDVRLYRGDCRDVWPELPSPDLVFTDPPFGISLEAHSDDSCMDGSPRRRLRASGIANDGSLEVAEAVIEWADMRQLPLVVFGSPYRPYGTGWRNILVWDKGEGVGGGGDMATCWKRTAELIYIRRNKPLREGRDGAVLNYPVGTGSDFEHHPCQKPVRLLRYLICQLTDVGDTVLDPCMGSGSTGLACVQTGRKFIGIELDPTHYATALKRLTHATGAGPGQLFGAA